MTNDDFWEMISGLASSLDGGREFSEQTLNDLQAELNAFPRNARDDIRRQMILIVAGLSRLEVRLIDSDGPLKTAV
jgi:hypothetical protein